MNYSDYSFKTTSNYGIKNIIEVMKRYKEILSKIYKKTDLDIFLDTNILLQIYDISINEREKYLEFFKENLDRIHIPNTVINEFLNNRELKISTFKSNLDNIPNDFQTNVINKFNHYKNSQKKLFVDFPHIQEKLENLNNDLSVTYTIINETIKEHSKYFDNLEYDDEYLNEFSNLNIIDSLSEETLNEIKKDYDCLSGIFVEKKDINKYSNKVIPGLGDKFEKPDNPYGDFIIYHEIINHMLSSKKSALFITNDVKKNDWLNNENNPYIHHLIASYNATGQLLVPIDGTRFFKEIMDFDTESVYGESDNRKNDIEFDPETGIMINNLEIELDSYSNDDDRSSFYDYELAIEAEFLVEMLQDHMPQMHEDKRNYTPDRIFLALKKNISLLTGLNMDDRALIVKSLGAFIYIRNNFTRKKIGISTLKRCHNDLCLSIKILRDFQLTMNVNAGG